MVELEFYDPSGNLEITQRHASRLDSLNGKRIGILTGEQWQAERTLPLLKTIMEADFPDIEVLPLDTFPVGEHAVGAEFDHSASQGKRCRWHHHWQRGLRLLLDRFGPRGCEARKC